MEFKDLYTLEETKTLGVDELLLHLRRCWGFEETEPIVVYGQINKVERSNDSTFYTLTQIKNKKWQTLTYPLKNYSGRESCFIGGNLPAHYKPNELVIAELKLAPQEERDKHNNPFEMIAPLSSIQKLVEIPEHILEQGIHRDSIENWLLELVSATQAEKIEESIAELQAKLEICTQSLQAEKGTLHEIVAQKTETEAMLQQLQAALEEVEREQKTSVQRHTKELSALKKEREILFQEKQQELDTLILQREEILNRLNKFIEEKAQILQGLDILDEDTFANFKGEQELPTHAENSYLLKDFENIGEAISHVQAYLHDKGIMYRRNVLENFYTLLCTHDLIVLAGDSGSGKTNLVKAFAEAIGGKSYIIPVKPNWTSAEDLLGYYNPIEQSYLSTPFLDALLEAKKNPAVPHLICLDEMNLARVEYYFADFLSLLEERNHQPTIPLYSQAESTHLVSEAKNFLALIDETKNKLGNDGIESFIQILKDEKFNNKLHELCGFKDGDSLLKYHTRLRKAFESYLNNPAKIELPKNVFFIGAINVDETTHYLSPKILDRAHIIRFTNPLLQNWQAIREEVEEYKNRTGRSTIKPVFLSNSDFTPRTSYPQFNVEEDLTRQLVHITKEYLVPLGIEFGLRTIRQASNYATLYKQNAATIVDEELLNNIVRQKILPKLMFDGVKKVDQNRTKADVLGSFLIYLRENLREIGASEQDNAQFELNNTILNAEANDGVVNYWSR